MIPYHAILQFDKYCIKIEHWLCVKEAELTSCQKQKGTDLRAKNLRAKSPQVRKRAR